jgi:hypothetical protein
VTRLDDLLHYDEPEAPRPTSHRERPSRWLALAVLLAAVVALIVYGVLRVFGLDLPYLLLFALLLTVQVVRRVLRDLAAVRVPAGLRRPLPGPAAAAEGGWGGRDGLNLAVSAWQSRLAWLHSRADPRQFVRTVQPRLVQIIDERLRRRHGFTAASDPRRARAVLGEPLWRFVTEPVTRNPTPRELAALVKHVEEL